MRKCILTAASILAIMPGVARAAEPACLSPAEFSSLAGYALPSVISGTSQRCSATLAPDAYLSKNGKALASRYAARKDASWPGAKAAFLKLSSGKNPDAAKLLGGVPDDSLQQMLDAVMEGMASQQIPVERCDTIDKFVRLLAPLPPENTAELIGLTVGLASKAKTAAPAASATPAAKDASAPAKAVPAKASKLAGINVCPT